MPPAARNVRIRRAVPRDLAGIEALLLRNDLPAGDVADHHHHFLVAVEDGRRIGCVGLELHGDIGLLRSLAVERRHRHRGIGSRLCDRIAARARRLGVRDLFLLTTDAASFFSRLGFSRVGRDSLPPAVRGTLQFRCLCPSTAIGMRRQIGRRGPEPIDHQVESFHRVFTELVRKYQFRDRQELACHGLTVSQCHALEVLGEDGFVRMGSLAARLHLTESTATRIVDQLARKDLVVRKLEADDRRVCCVGLSRTGKRLFRRVRTELHARERAFLERMGGRTRQFLIVALGELSGAVDAWRTGPCQGGRDEEPEK